MAKDTFKFKEFVVRHDRSSMRVGTDAVLLGAWAFTDLSATNKDMCVLDIGCGCGLIALMIAQRFHSARVLGIDIDVPSVEEAMENVICCPFGERVRFQHADSWTLVQGADLGCLRWGLGSIGSKSFPGNSAAGGPAPTLGNIAPELRSSE